MKSPRDYRRDQRRRVHPGKGMPTPGNPGAGSVAPGVPFEAQTRHPALSSPPCSRTVPWSRHLFSPTNIPQLDGAESFISEQGLNNRVTPASDFAPLSEVPF